MDNELITEVATIRINPDDVMPIDNISGLTRWLEDEYAVLTKTHSLGFTAQESQILQNNSEETIRRLADERKAVKE